MSVSVFHFSVLTSLFTSSVSDRLGGTLDINEANRLDEYIRIDRTCVSTIVRVGCQSAQLASEIIAVLHKFVSVYPRFFSTACRDSNFQPPHATPIASPERELKSHHHCTWHPNPPNASRISPCRQSDGEPAKPTHPTVQHTFSVDFTPTSTPIALTSLAF